MQTNDPFASRPAFEPLSEDTAELWNESIGRRRFLKRTGGITASTILAMQGFSSISYAGDVTIGSGNKVENISKSSTFNRIKFDRTFNITVSSGAPNYNVGIRVYNVKGTGSAQTKTKIYEDAAYTTAPVNGFTTGQTVGPLDPVPEAGDTILIEFWCGGQKVCEQTGTW